MKNDDKTGLICLAIGAILLAVGALLNTFQLVSIEKRIKKLENIAVNVYEIPTNIDATATDATITDAIVTNATITDATINDATVTDATITDATVTDATITDVAIVLEDSTMVGFEEQFELSSNGTGNVYDLEDTLEDIPNPTTTEEPAVVNPPMTDYDFNLLCQVVECETHGADRESKAHIVHVIRNRIYRSEWGSSWSSVILEPYQFGRRADVTQDTINAVNYALSIEDTTYGCIAFHSGGWSATFFGYRYVFTDNVGHKFYI